MTTVILLTLRICALFWKISSFLITPLAWRKMDFPLICKGIIKMEGTMSRHSTEFKAEQELPAGAVEGLRKADPQTDHGNVVAAPKTRNIRGQLRKLLLAGAAVAVLSGAVW